MNAPAIIVLTGFMGTGKSTVGRLLAERLGYEWVDTDDVIERRHGPIAEIFRTQGEAAFRRHERNVIAELAERTGRVISTGGKLMLDPVNVTLLDHAAVFCLTADVDTIVTRTSGDGIVRPLLADGDAMDRITALLDERAVGYAAFDQVPTDGRTPEEVVADIVARFDDATT